MSQCFQTQIPLSPRILYERLAAVPPTPGRQTQDLPPEHDPMFTQQPQAPAEHAHPAAYDQHALEAYVQHNPNSRVVETQDGRVIAIEATPAHGSVLGITGPPPPAGIPVIPAYRHEPSSEYATDRHLVPQVREPQEVPNNEAAVHHSRSTSSHLPGTHSHHRSRSSSSRNEVDPYNAEPTRIDTFPPSQPVHSRSSSLSGDGQPDSRPRRLDIHESSHPHQHSQVPAPNLPPSPQQVHSPTHGRLHNHQRVGPGVHLHRQQERDPEETRQLMREREIEREREREREVLLRERLAREEEELRRTVGWPPQGYGPSTSDDLSRAQSPRSESSDDMADEDRRQTARIWAPGGYRADRSVRAEVGGSAGARPPYDVGYDEYEREHQDRMPVSSTRGYPADYHASDSRKRSYHDMQIDDERGGEHEASRAGGTVDTYSTSQDYRGPRRAHEDEGDGTRLHTSSIRDEKPMDQDD